MKNKRVLLVSTLCLAALVFLCWKAGRSRVDKHAGQPERGDRHADLASRVHTLPKPALAHQPQLAATRPQAAAVPPASSAAQVLTEAQLEPLRRAFTPPRIAPRTDVPAGRQIILSNRLIVSPLVRSFPAASGAQSLTRRGTTPFIVQFNAPVNDDARKTLESAGAFVRGYFPHNALLAELTPPALAQLKTLASVQALAEYLPSDKVQPFLASLPTHFSAASRVQVSLQTLSPDDIAHVSAAVRAAGGEVTGTAVTPLWGTVRATLPLSSVQALTALGDVQWIEEYVAPVLFNDQAASVSHLNTTNAWNTWKLTGKGQIVGHADTGLDTGVADTLHPDFQSNIVAIIAHGRPGNASDTNGHGTHTAGSLCGSGAASAGQFRGMAYEAGLVHQSVMDDYGGLNGLTDLYGIFAESYAYGARIHSDSWGSKTYGAYGNACRTVDLFAWNNPDHLAVFANGNDGTDANRNGVIDLGAVGSPASAKNVIAVGAAESDRPTGSGGYSSSTWYSRFGSKFYTSPIRNDYISYSATTYPYRQGMAAFSSRGPTQDGRVKPDVVAPGTDIISTKSSAGSYVWTDYLSNPRYCFGGGTSMATPLVAGTAALVRQYAVERGGITNPSAALLKAMLTGGSRSLTPGQYGTGAFREIPASSPNSVEGWGQPDIASTVHPTNSVIRLYDRISPATGATNTFAITVTVSNTPLDIALAWIDYPATAAAGVTLVNDLDLLVTAPDGSSFFPNAGTARDDRNTVESLRVASAKTGVYQVRVIGYNVPYTGGAAALYVRGAIAAAPVIVHTPLGAQIAEAAPYRVNCLIQSVSPLTNGEARVRWTAGTASMATGLWQTVTAAWLGAAAYRADIPQQPSGTYIHYSIQAAEGSYDACLPQSAPTSNFVFYAGYEVQLAVDGSPARYGSASPSYGTNTVVSHFPFAVSASAAVSVSNGMRRACAGWTGTGDVPASGTTAATTLSLHQDSSITWLWRAEVALTNRYRTADSGLVFGENVSWHAEGSLASSETAPDLVLVNSAPYAFAGWLIDGLRWPDDFSSAQNPATGILMSKPRLAQADYLPFWLDTDGNALSDWWESRYFGGANYGIEAGADYDGDGWTNLGEFLDNTDPLNSDSYPTPPAIAVTPLDPFQTARPPWTVYADISDNLTVAVADLVWRERGDLAWKTNNLSWVEGNTFAGTLNPPSHGMKRVDYFIAAGDLIGYYDPTYCVSSAVYRVMGDFDEPWLNVSPETLGLVEVASTCTNLAVSVANLAGADLLWTARVAYASAPFAATNTAWTHSGYRDLWCVTTNRSWNGDAVWYCGNPTMRAYTNSCYALLDTPPFTVGTGGGLLFRQWIKTEYDSGLNDTHYWDGAVVSVSTDNGKIFTVIEPTTGYPYLITPNMDSPFADDQPCLAGNGSGWETLLLDLSACAGQTVIVRFEFGSDAGTVDEGWYVAGVTPFSLDIPAAPWLTPHGAWSGCLPDQWFAPVELTVNPTALARDEESFACVRFDSNDPTSTPLVPLTVRRGYALSVAATGPGFAVADSHIHFRTPRAAITMQADAGAYLYAFTVNGVPQPGPFDFSSVSRIYSVSNLTEDLDLHAWFTNRTWTLSVNTPYGVATPSAGAHTYTHGTLIEASVTTPLTEPDNRTQYACSGWQLTGHTPSLGASAQVTFALTNDASLAWLWQTNFWLTAQAGTHGTVDPTNGWYVSGHNVDVTAYPSDYYHFYLWSGDTVGATFEGPLLTLPMTAPRTVFAQFEPTVTANHGVPEYWLASYGWTSNFEAETETDHDGDGMVTWKEWYADTNPTNARSLLTLTDIVKTNQSLTLTWIGGTTRTQIIDQASSLTTTWQAVYTNLPPTPITNLLSLPYSPEDTRFYRIRIP